MNRSILVTLILLSAIGIAMLPGCDEAVQPSEPSAAGSGGLDVESQKSQLITGTLALNYCQASADYEPASYTYAFERMKREQFGLNNLTNCIDRSNQTGPCTGGLCRRVTRCHWTVGNKDVDLRSWWPSNQTQQNATNGWAEYSFVVSPAQSIMQKYCHCGSVSNPDADPTWCSLTAVGTGYVLSPLYPVQL
jgi:hypothetical protein